MSYHCNWIKYGTGWKCTRQSCSFVANDDTLIPPVRHCDDPECKKEHARLTAERTAKRQLLLEPIAASLGVTLSEPLFGSLPARMLGGGRAQPGFTIEHAAARIAICRICEHWTPEGCEGKIYPLAAIGNPCEAKQRWADAILGLRQREPCNKWQDPSAVAYREAMTLPIKEPTNVQ